MNLPDLVMTDWPNRACRDADPDLFFNEGRGRPNDSDIAEAKLVCSGCPEWLKCLHWALDHDEQGIWGGTTDDERRKAVKKPLTQEQRRRAVRRLHREGFNDVQVAEQLGTTHSTVQNDRMALGLVENFTTNLAERRAKVAELHALGLNDREIGAQLDSSRDQVRNDRNMLGLTQNHRKEPAA